MLRELALANKRKKKKTVICAIDASKAFDKVNRINLWAKMIGKIEPYFLRVLINYYSVAKILIVLKEKQTSLFKTTRGVKQGGPLSPWLFTVYIDELGVTLNIYEAGIKIGSIRINNILYADDIVLMANDTDELNSLLHITEIHGQEFEINFNPLKTNFMVLFCKLISNQKIGEIKFQGEKIKRVVLMKYLGIWIDETLNNLTQYKARTKAFTFGYRAMIQCGIRHNMLDTKV
jgi:hypothetical protein